MKLKKVSKIYGQQEVVSDIDLDIPRGRFVAFIGPNGAGKSTLLAMMSRLLKKDEGFLSIRGQEIESWNSAELAKELSILKQQQQFQAKLTVKDLVSFGRFPYSKGRLTKADEETIEQAMRYVEIETLQERLIDTLSGGQAQRVSIAMVLAQDTEFILLDEPLNNLDMKQSIAMMKLLRTMVDQLNKTVILVIHDINMASQYVDEMVAFKDGKLFCQGSTDQIMRKEVLAPLFEMDVHIQSINGKKICLYQ